MSVRKLHDFLKSNHSDEELDRGYDSDAEADSKVNATSRAIKRRKVDESDDESNDSFHSFEDEDEQEKASVKVAKPAEGSESDTRFAALDEAVGRDGDGHLPSEEGSDESKRTLRQPTTNPPKNVAAAQTAAKKSGVVYISRVPPFMKPQTLRHFLTRHAPKGLGRIFLTPEEHAAHLRRVKSGGNKKKSFTDGWVEFASKKDAKIAAETLNGNTIGGKKGSFYYDDLWNMKYLKGFKWSHLTEQIANENAERAARLREEVRKTRKENKAFLEDVERGKMLATVEMKANRKGDRGSGDAAGGSGGKKAERPGREFKQRKVHHTAAKNGSGEQSAELTRVLGKIF